MGINVVCTVAVFGFRRFSVGLRRYSVGDGITLNTAVRRSQPGLKSPPKLWWAKEITPEFHIAGRPTARQIKYASEGGFKSILSLYNYEDNDSGNFGGENLPTTIEAEALAISLGLGYKTLIDQDCDWCTPEVVRKFANSIEDLPRPILLYSNKGHSIAYVTLMHMASLTRNSPGFKPRITSENFYRIAAAMGLDFTAEKLTAAVAEITGEEIVTDPPTPDVTLANWRDWWLAHPVHKNWFATGQLRRADVKVLEKTGFKSVVNLRLGTSFNGKPSQEPVTLLNIDDNTPTYDANSNILRQTTDMLANSRIYPTLDESYISEDSKVNYEAKNVDEFGDDTGFNEEIERQFFLQHALAYYHLPINITDAFTLEQWNDMKDTLIEAGSKGPVVLHCRLGKRTAYIGALIAAVQEGYSLEWALQRLLELGYEASPEVRPDFYEVYKAVLPTEASLKAKKAEL